ncbi:winged helix-turn-helix domain-containing protein [Sinorhizobium psoraleae]|uniref:winged helix-turn-helix domain-containing protein n=1 Tax=Sinorhizobium psoraleae TaxID=520838 RepID=UPI0035E3DF55
MKRFTITETEIARSLSCTRASFFREFDAYDKTLDVYVSRLRKKLKHLSEESGDCIQTVRGSGYRYSEL